MDHDYYQILNVDPAAGPEAIRKAYLRRAMIDHPDRGGSDERMKLVNEAFAVLSDAQARRHYDAARANRADAAAQVTAAAAAEQARRRAADYPRSWPEFERWVNRVGTDFSQARYSSWNHGMWYFPVVRDSVTGWAFVVIGGIIGAALAVSLITVPKRLTRDGLDRNQIYLGAAGAMAGAWVFAGAHRLISEVIREVRAKAAAPTPTPSPPPTPPDRVFACEQCGQKLRVPRMDAHMRVTCTSCRHQFWLPPEPGPGPAG